MFNILFIEKVTKNLRANYKKFKYIKSAYLYGSVLTDSFHKKSDIDVLFIVEDIKDRQKFLKKIKTIRAKKKV